MEHWTKAWVPTKLYHLLPLRPGASSLAFLMELARLVKEVTGVLASLSAVRPLNLLLLGPSLTLQPTW